MHCKDLRIAISWVVVLAPTQRFSAEWVNELIFATDDEMIESLTAISQNSLTTISNEGESRGKLGSSDSASETSNSSDGELHFDCDVMIWGLIDGPWMKNEIDSRGLPVFIGDFFSHWAIIPSVEAKTYPKSINAVNLGFNKCVMVVVDNLIGLNPVCGSIVWGGLETCLSSPHGRVLAVHRLSYNIMSFMSILKSTRAEMIF